MTKTQLQFVVETDSTNALLRRLQPQENHAVYAGRQSQGRGQRGNVWLSEPGANLLFSLLWHPDGLPANRQFSLSQATALAVVEFLKRHGVKALVKWPNDIYVADTKICGILIENAVSSKLESSIIGIGLNLNQTEFPATLPNPESLRRLTGETLSPDDAAKEMLECLEELLPMAETEEGREELHRHYMECMYRNDGQPYPYRDVASGNTFHAAIADVEPMGFLLLDDTTGQRRRYAFKEVEFLHP